VSEQGGFLTGQGGGGFAPSSSAPPMTRREIREREEAEAAAREAAAAQPFLPPPLPSMIPGNPVPPTGYPDAPVSPARPLSRRELREMEQRQQEAQQQSTSVFPPPADQFFAPPAVPPQPVMAPPPPPPPPVMAPPPPVSEPFPQAITPELRPRAGRHGAPPTEDVAPVQYVAPTEYAAPAEYVARPEPAAPALPPVFSAPVTDRTVSLPMVPEYLPDDDAELASSREVGSGTPTTHALILPTTPIMDISGPVGDTGEIIMTGQIPLPRLVTENGHQGQYDYAEENFDELMGAETTALTAPVRASHAVSSKSNNREFEMVRKAPWGTAATVLGASALLLVLAAAGLLAVALLTDFLVWPS
jgi:hypothetical protein